MPRCAVSLAVFVLAGAVAPGGAGSPQPPPLVTIHVDRPENKVSPLLFGCSLPAPGTPGADALLPELLRNRSFEKVAWVGPKAMPEGWNQARGWQLFEFGGRHAIVRADRTLDEPLVILRRRNWNAYRLTLLGRKIDGPDGLSILFDVQDSHNHVRWTLGAHGNRQHVLESVGAGIPRPLAPPVPGRIETGRCYRIDVTLRRGVLQCSLDGRLVHHVGDARFPWGGVGLGASRSTAEYLDLAVYEPKDVPLFLLDNPAKSKLDTLAADWEPLRAEGNKVAFHWEALYPFNSHFSQGVRVDAYQGGDAGIRQRRIPVTAGATYRGRLHLRGTGKAVIAVSLRSREGALYASEELTGPAAGIWEPREFVLKPNTSDPQADFCITVAGTATVLFDQVSLIPEAARSPWGLRSDVVASLRTLRPAFLCWPAGPGANQYHWRRGIGPVDLRPAATLTGGQQPTFEPCGTDFGTDEFLSLCRELGAEPLLVLNPYLGPLCTLDWINYCNGEAASPLGKERAANGHPEPYGVRRWLVGGERMAEPDAQDYAVMLAELARELRGFLPAPELIAVGSPPLADCAADAREAKAAGPMVAHIAKPLRWPAAAADQSATWTALERTAGSLRDQGLHLALLDVCPAPDASSSAYPFGALLNALTRSGGPGALASLFFPAAELPSVRAAWALARAHPLEQTLHIENPAGGALDLVAGLSRQKLVIRIAHPAESDAVARLKLLGLGARRLAPTARHYALGTGAAQESELSVQGDELRLSLKAGQPIHVVVVELSGE
ncbi:MAG TPA: hypothetical protein PLE19_23055 [Planctomycetota bacterium]|nr:hypothetical protein [Planctomycetota bacterium]HRR80815.1 hypothetical protein [Planctomycetota bacterium]HRT96564.1 hypothetical protein [Planctomycetota bacterium]